MSGSRYAVFDDPYCYKNTFVLKNRANLRDARRLKAFELEMSSLRAEEPLPNARRCAANRVVRGGPTNFWNWGMKRSA